MNTGWENFGFVDLEYALWDWIDDNQISRDIDIVSLSSSTNVSFNTQSIKMKWKSLTTKNVMMISSAGNFGRYLNENGTTEEYWRYPQYYTKWYAVGSIDHETRSDGSGSTKNERSDFSAWYRDYTIGNHIVNWLEPGNGIPCLTNAVKEGSIYKGTWKYLNGTSASTPYLAAIIALIITGYHNGIGDSTDPTLSKVIEILLYASSRSTFDQKMGYGFVDAYIAYGKAYTEGVLAS
jgi:subtilase family serine protease